MKKITGFLLLIVLLSGCVGINPSHEFTYVGDRVWVFEHDETFNPMEGFTIYDDKSMDVTSLFDIEFVGTLPANPVSPEPGSYQIRMHHTQSTFVLPITRLIHVLPEGLEKSAIDPSLLACERLVTQDVYVITWCDEFDGQGDNLNEFGVDLSKWGFQTGTGSQYGLTDWGNGEAQFYLERNAHVEEGRLIIEAKKESYAGKAFTSSRLYTGQTFNQLYGRFEARIKLPVGQGFWPAFWMMPQDSAYGTWAASGEIDIMEAKGRFPFSSSGAIHYGGTWPNNTYTHFDYIFSSGQGIDNFHLYAVEWDETEIRWFVNNHLFGRTSNWFSSNADYPAPFDQPFYLILNLAIGGHFDDYRLPEDQDLPGLMEVDYVRVYQKIPQ